jgi:hypothetical protein
MLDLAPLDDLVIDRVKGSFAVNLRRQSHGPPWDSATFTTSHPPVAT